MGIEVKRTGDGNLTVGGVLTEEQKEALGSISVNPNDILENLDSLNEEIEDTHEVSAEEQAVVYKEVPQVKKPKARKPQNKIKDLTKKTVNKTNKAKRKKEMNLDQELSSLDTQLETGGTGGEEVDAAVPETMHDQIVELLQNTEGAPSQAQINAWKREYGDKGVHVIALGEGDLYVFTHLRRGQWKKIQDIISKAQQQQATDVEEQLKEKVVQHCVLWPRPLPVEFFYNSRAGVVDSIYQVILLNSYFLSPQQAMILTTQL